MININNLKKVINSCFFKSLPAKRNEVNNEFDLLNARVNEFKSLKKNYYSFEEKKEFREKKFLEKMEWYKRKNRLQDVVVYKLVFKVTRNNVFITVMDPMGRYVFYSSGGLNYFFLRRRTVSVANILLGENLGSELRSKLICALDLEFHGLPFKSHRLNFIKGLVASNIIIRNIIDKTPISHNGCSWKKKRRKKFKKRR